MSQEERLSGDFHIHPLGRGGTRTPEKIVLTAQEKGLDMVAVCHYHEYNLWVNERMSSLVDQTGMETAAAVEINTNAGHLELVMSRPQSDVIASEIAKEVPKYRDGNHSPEEVAINFAEKFNAFAVVVHPILNRLTPLFVCGMRPKRIIQFAREMNGKIPVAVEEFSGERDRYMGGKASQVQIAMGCLIKNLVTEGIKLSPFAGSDDHGFTLGDNRVTWKRVHNKSAFESLYQQVREGSTVGLGPQSQDQEGQRGVQLFLIAGNHLIPRFQENFLKKVFPMVTGNIDLVPWYLYRSGQISDADRSYLKELKLNSNS